jgi:hypothetical protein
MVFFPPEHPYSPVKPIFEAKESFTAIFTNPGLLHAMLSTLAAALSRRISNKLDPDAVYHLNQTITIANKNIANFRQESTVVKDNTICVVSALAHIEVRTFSRQNIS